MFKNCTEGYVTPLSLILREPSIKAVTLYNHRMFKGWNGP